ncbi:MAG: hypothetical protein M1142_01995 [Patescibacteria group bacterium]|nr:hypothetical protein [Patescibacteria group bacterium]
MDKKSKNYTPRVGGGWPFFFVVLVFGLILTGFGVGIGGGASARIPFTQSNISVGGSLGKKEVVQQALPNYLSHRVASNQDFFNYSTTLTIWIAEGMGMVVLGEQPEAPLVDINLNLKR